MTFNIELAGIPIQICCKYKINKDFFVEYLTDRQPELTVIPAEEDIQRTKRVLEQMAEREGMQYSWFSDSCYLENNTIHALISEKLVPYNTLLFHGSALCMDGEAVIFTAPSGTGKSTQARFWRELFGRRVQMINDDKPLIRTEDNKIIVYGSPWNGKHSLSSNISAPLKAILLVTRSDKNRLEPLSRADAFETMIRQGYISENPETRLKILSMERLISETVPFYRMYCNLEREAAQTAWAGIQTGQYLSNP